MQRDPSLPSLASAIPPDGLWRVRVLGALQATSADSVLTRFPGRPVAALLARLALAPDRSHAREELIELLWPGIAIETGRKRLRQALSTLRHLLEPAGSSPVLVADRQTVRVNGDAIACDAVEFERAVRAGRDAEAVDLYRGELLPGFYDEWVERERQRLAALHERSVERVALRDSASMLRTGDGAAPAGVVAAPSRALRPAEGERRLPSYLSSFVGREDDRSDVDVAIAAHRLVCLTGAAGCGKTRLATEVARTSIAFDAAVFVALAACRDGAQVADHVRAAVGLPVAAGDPLGHLATHFAGRRVLLVLDNVEQLVGAGGGEAIAELLARLPGAHTLVTSRRALRVAGEREHALRPLALPQATVALATAARNAAVALFVDRARGVRSDFGLTAANVADVVAICRALDGVPLALEIAATRIRTYAPREMAAELERGFAMLVRTGAGAERTPRHGSLHAAIDWSWSLLTSERREFLAGLSVFRGSFAASEVAAVTGHDDAHDALDALVADSLLHVQRDPSAMRLRFQMLQVVREHVRERLDATSAARLRSAHRRCFLERALALGDAHRTVDADELANIVEALQTALADGEIEVAVALGLALRVQWEWVGTPPEALALLRRAADAAPVGTARLASFLGLLARLLLQAGQPEHASSCAARALAEAGAGSVDEADARFAVASVEWVWKRGGAAAIGPAREALRLATALGARESEARCLLLVAAITLWHERRPHEAEALYRSAAEVFAAIGHSLGVLQTWHGRMACLQAMGRHDGAIAIGLTHEPRAEEMGHVEAQILLWNLLALSYEKTRRYADALDACRREARLAIRQHKVYNIAYALWNQCHYLARLRRPDEATRMMAFSQKYWVDQFGPLQPADERHVEKVRRLVCAQVGVARWQALWREGLALPAHEGLALGSAPD